MSQEQRRSTLVAVWPVLPLLSGLFCYMFMPEGARFPAILAGVVAYAAANWLVPVFRLNLEAPICPINWAHFIFFLQIVVLPLSLVVFGPKLGSLPYLPSDFAINMAILLSTGAFVAFVTGYWFWTSSKGEPKMESDREEDDVEGPPPLLILLFAFLGIVGFALTFRTPSNLIDYYSSPANRIIFIMSYSGTWSLLFGQFLRAFLGVAVVMMWCRWIERERKRRHWLTLAAQSIPFVIAVVISFGSFSYNRAAFVVPLLGMAGAFSERVKRISLKVIMAVALVSTVILFYMGSFRSQEYSAAEVIRESGIRTNIMDKVDMVSEVQIYGIAPQFLGFFMEESNWGEDLLWGKSLVASVLAPLPEVGKPFRESSGTFIYNSLIYGWTGIIDQVAPFQGEMFINFHLPGVLLAFLLLGFGTGGLQRAFSRCRSALGVYVTIYTSVWVLFLIQGGLGAASQVFIYFFLPLYVLWGIWLLKPKRSGQSHREIVRLEPQS